MLSGLMQARVLSGFVVALVGALVSLLVVGACVTTTDGTANSPCAFNADCNADLSCVASDGARTCRALSSPNAQTCTSSADCADGKACKAGRCGVAPSSVLDALSSRCEDNADCTDGTLCDQESKRCKAPVVDAQACSSSWDCRTSETCVFGRCERQAPFTGCRSDLECGGFQRCIVGRCQ